MMCGAIHRIDAIFQRNHGIVARPLTAIEVATTQQLLLYMRVIRRC